MSTCAGYTQGQNEMGIAAAAAIVEALPVEQAASVLALVAAEDFGAAASALSWRVKNAPDDPDYTNAIFKGAGAIATGVALTAVKSDVAAAAAAVVDPAFLAEVLIAMDEKDAVELLAAMSPARAAAKLVAISGGDGLGAEIGSLVVGGLYNLKPVDP
jgi:pyruvate/2-oxoacid:ferredoxin oxidoreductase beta subunit